MIDFIPADFEKAFPELVKVEGGYVHNLADTGGETYCGISRRNWPSWPGWLIVDGYKSRGGGVAALNALLAQDTELQGLIKAFYRKEFWEAVRGDELDHRVACELFDTAVNMGKQAAIESLQDVLNMFNNCGTAWGNLPVTGNFLSMTMAAVQAMAKKDGWVFIVNVLNLRQAARYFEIIRNKESQEQFARGWIKARVLAQMEV